jgi:hypothetical protein
MDLLGERPTVAVTHACRWAFGELGGMQNAGLSEQVEQLGALLSPGAGVLVQRKEVVDERQAGVGFRQLDEPEGVRR